MSRLVLLDAGPLGVVTNPNASPETEAASRWLVELPVKRLEAAVPEIADYEVVIATTNPGHLGQFAVARSWQEIG